MKLVQLLAKELKEWPGDVGAITQDKLTRELLDYYHCPLRGGNEREVSRIADDAGEAHDGASGAAVTRAEWQAEREKMNKPKWIRHRGGWMPVGAATIVEVRLRCGDIQKHEACYFLWRHKDCDSAASIMAYRVIEENKDQEIEEVIPKHMAFGYASKEEMVAQIGEECPFAQVASTAEKTNFGTITYKLEIDATEAAKEIDSLVAKWGQIESPLKWRDAIIHCQAIIEDCEREIERNVNLLDAEGLMMQKDSKKAMQHYQTAIDMSDWRNWQAGDIFEVVKKTDYFTVGNRYSVKYTANTDAPITATDDDGDEFCLLMEEIKFIRRP